MRHIESTLFKDHSTSATFKSRWIDTRGCTSLHIHLSLAATGTPVGILSVEESNDPQIARNAEAGLNQDSTSDTVSAVAVTLDSGHISGTGLTVNGANTTLLHVLYPASWVRVVYTRTSGGGASAATAWISGNE